MLLNLLNYYCIMNLKTISALIAPICMYQISHAGAWNLVSVNPTDSGVIQTGGVISPGLLSNGATLTVSETISHQSISVNTSAAFNSSSYFDFKYVVPYTYPQVNLNGSGTVTGRIDGVGAGGSTYNTQASVFGLISALYHRDFTVSNYNSSVNWSFGSSAYYVDGSGYYHCKVYFPTAALASVTAAIDTSNGETEAVDTISAKLTVTVDSY